MRPIGVVAGVIVVQAILLGCSRESQDVGQALANTYNTRTLDRAILKNQKRINDHPDCAPFKEEIRVVGESFQSTANAAFHREMIAIRDDARQAGCLRR